ncbi:MAG: ABC transporter ATP-binding protein [Jatrophihabitantaceae bacterium]
MSLTGLDQATVALPGADGEQVVLDRLSLLAEDGELMVVLGPSGSGKTTLLRAIAGLEQLRSGQVLIRGRPVTTVPPHARDLAMVFEQSSLIPTLDVAHNLAFGLRMRHRPAEEIAEQVALQARRLGLRRLLSRLPSQLSPGQRGQVGIGRAIARVPTAFLLDEPLAHLDAGQRWQMRRHLAELVKGSGVTTFYVTHDQSDALAIADRVAVLRDGALVQLGPPAQLYDRPVDLFVAGLLGSVPIGLLPARLVASGSGSGFRIGSRVLPLWSPAPVELRGLIGREVVLGLRVEDVHDASTDGDPALPRLPATVVRAEHTGPDLLVSLSMAARPARAPDSDPADLLLGSAQLRARFPRSAAVTPGSTVQVCLDVTRAHVFDPVTGRALAHPPLVGPAG